MRQRFKCWSLLKRGPFFSLSMLDRIYKYQCHNIHSNQLFTQLNNLSTKLSLLLRQLICPFSYGVAVFDVLPPVRSYYAPSQDPVVSLVHLLLYNPSTWSSVFLSPYVPAPPGPSSFSPQVPRLFSVRDHTILILPPVLSLTRSATFTVPLIRALGILSLLVTPDIHLNIFISATFILFSFTFLIGVAFMPYIMAGCTTVLKTFPFSFTGILLSHSTPDTSLQFFHPAFILLVTSLSRCHPLLLLTQGT